MRRLSLLLMIFVSLPVWAQVGISPRTLDVILEEDGRSHSFRLFNLSDQPYNVSASVTNWTMDENNQVQLIDATESSLDQWMIVNPLKFEIAPGESQTVRVGFRPLMELADGEYRAMVYFDQILPPDPKPESQQIRSRFRIGAAVYVHVGPVVNQAEVESVVIENGAVAVRINNTGSRHVRMDGQWSIWPAAAYPGADVTTQIVGLGKPDLNLPSGVISADFLPRVPVLPGHARTVRFTLEGLQAPAGPLVLDMDAQFGNAALDRAVEFNWAGNESNSATQ